MTPRLVTFATLHAPQNGKWHAVDPHTGGPRCGVPLRRVTVAHLSPVVRWRLACPCGRAPVALLTRDEVNDEMRKHPVVP